MGGHIRCKQCKAMSKRTKKQRGLAALRGKEVCKFHGGRSTGAKTKEGRQRCAEAKTVHGRETRQTRKERSAKLTELYELEMLGRKTGVITGPMMKGRKPGSKTTDNLFRYESCCFQFNLAWFIEKSRNENHAHCWVVPAHVALPNTTEIPPRFHIGWLVGTKCGYPANIFGFAARLG